MRIDLRFPFTVLVTTLLIASVASPSYASGPGTGGRRVRLDDAPAGPFLIRAVTSPTPPTLENLYIEVRVVEAAGQALLTDVDVLVRAEHLDGEGTTLEEVATHDIAPIPTEYAAHLRVDAVGVWEITIQVDGPPGVGEVSFLERVQDPPNLTWVIAIGAPVASLFLLAGIFIWLQRNAQSKRPES